VLFKKVILLHSSYFCCNHQTHPAPTKVGAPLTEGIFYKKHLQPFAEFDFIQYSAHELFSWIRNLKNLNDNSLYDT
jgi:hypothetical protein